MPFVVKDDVVPEDMVKKNNRLYSVVMAVIIVTFLLQAIINSLLAMCKYESGACTDNQNNELGYAFLLMSFIGVLICVLVAVYLFTAVFKIRSFLLKEGIKQERINVKIMLLHTSTFGLFLLSIVAIEITFLPFATSGKQLTTAAHIYFVSMAMTCITSFTSQIVLSVILYQLGSYEISKQLAEEIKEEEEYPAIQVVQFDAHADLQARIWNQFMCEGLDDDEDDDFSVDYNDVLKATRNTEFVKRNNRDIEQQLIKETKSSLNNSKTS